MLNLLHRHILKEILVATGLAMGLFVFVLLMGNALRDVAGLVAAGKLDVIVFLKVLGLLIPYVASYALPLGMLTGTLIALGRLSSQGEITAMKSAGLSLYQIAAPVFLIAFIAMVGAVLVNHQYAPESRVMRRALLASAVTENPVDFIEERRFVHEFPGYVIYLGGRDGSKMKDFWIWVLDEKSKQVTQFVRAAEGEVFYDKETSDLILVVRDGIAEVRSLESPEDFGASLDGGFFGETSFSLPLDQIFGNKGKGARRSRIKEMTYAQLMEKRKQALATEAETNSEMSEDRLKIQVHVQKNFAMAYSVFSLAVFGVPLAIHVGRKETYANLGIALVIAMTYYFLIIIVSWLEGIPALRPDLLIWLPNLIFQGIGFWMIQKASRH